VKSRQLRACTECRKLIIVGSTPRGGRPRKTCGWDCYLARNRRLAKEARCSDAADIATWWLALSEEQRLAAIAHVRANPPPTDFIGGRHAWAYYSRAAFSCEGRVVSEVG